MGRQLEVGGWRDQLQLMWTELERTQWGLSSYRSPLRRIFGSWGERKALLVSISDTKLEEAGDVMHR